MKTQTIQFATVTKNGVVQKVSKSTILQPKTNFKGGSIKWYEDKESRQISTTRQAVQPWIQF